MKAVICTKYGTPEVLEFRDINKPVPKKNEVLIKIRGASVSSGDVRLRKFDFPAVYKIPMRLILGIRKPKHDILGSQFAGEIEAVGRNVTKFKVSDKIFGANGMKQGCYAQYVCIDENAVIAPMPSKLTFEEAACIPFGGMTAMQLLGLADILEGHSVLVYGASSAVGTAAVQLAVNYGAVVTAVCSKENFELVKALGASKTIDYHQQDFTQSGEKYDVIFDAVIKLDDAKCAKSLKADGAFISVKTLTKESAEKLLALKVLIEQGEYKPVVDKVYSLDDIVEAHRYVEAGHKKGNVAVTIPHDEGR